MWRGAAGRDGRLSLTFADVPGLFRLTTKEFAGFGSIVLTMF
jgi:hypothetical protein